MDLATLAGRTLDGKYRIEAELGSGGMGAVFRATHLGTDRAVALKIIKPRLSDDAQSLERFKREARASGRLQHPNVVNVTDFGIAEVDAQSVAYLAMEYLDGFTLSALLSRQPKLPLSLTADILEQVAIAVDEAHRLGIIHRDLKPENIWLRPDHRGGYQVKVLDFGVASFRESVLDDAAERLDVTSTETAVAPPHLTRAGTVIGTPAYMSPEQCRSAAATPRSDVYSLGIIAYQMLTGALPFGGSTLELIAKHMAAPPPPPPNVAPRVAEVVMSAMAKLPEDRPVSASAFAGALRARSDGPTMILRRAVALYAMRFDQFVSISATAHLPLLVWTVLSLPLFAIFGMRGFGLFFVSGVLMMIADPSMQWMTYLLVDHLREHPLEPISTSDVIRRLGERTGARGVLTRSRLYAHSFRVMAAGARLARASVMRHVTTPALFLLFGYIDGDDAEKALQISLRLAKEVSWRTRVTMYGFAIAASAAFAVVMLLGVVDVFGVPREIADVVSRAGMIACSLSLALFAAVISPLLTIAQAIFYFHARQAVGDPVSFAVEPRL